MVERTAPPDQAQRDRVATELDTTLFVEAGAGSGKTTALVGRVLALVRHGVELRSIAAITFTEKAGAELRDRLRRELEEAADASGPGSDDEYRARCRTALDQLDGAAIGTLHAFAQRLLSEHPIEAGLPPRVEVLDEVSSGVAFERRWSAFQEELLADARYEQTILLLLAAKVRTEAFRVLARAFDQSWDLVVDWVPDESPEPPSVADLLAPVLGELAALCDLRVECTDPGDKLSLRLDEIADYLAELRAVAGDDIHLLQRLSDHPSFRAANLGVNACWDGRVPKTEVHARLAAAGEQLDAIAGEVAQAGAHRIGSAIKQFTLGAAQARRRAGQLEFHDLLVMARSLVRDPTHGAEVRQRLHERYQRILLDEFQDTDPIQIDLAVRIAAADPLAPATATAPWFEVPLAPGHLFVVGDPKQSIYRFRRADIATFLAARDRFEADAHGSSASLTTNFRTTVPIVEWVNRTFGALMSEPPAEQLALSSQADYVDLVGVRPAAPIGPPVSVMGRTAHPPKTRADEVRDDEARDVAATITRIIAEGWSVADGVDADGVPRWRPARLGDVTVLVPARTSLPFLDDALTEAGIGYRAESSSLVYATRAVRDLLMVLRAVDDPTDRLRTVAALRTPLLACGDDDLARFVHERGGVLSIQSTQPDGLPAEDPVAAGLAFLRARLAERHWTTPSELLERIARDRRGFELGFAEGRPRDVWRRYRFVIDQARAWHEATGGGLRDYLGWVAQQTAEGARVAESVLPETDDDAVRVMTIHGSKGLEFPITIVSGLSSVPGGNTAAAEVRFPPDGRVAYKLGSKVMTTEFTATIPIDEQMGLDERIRLLYVATTRAKDHLVVSLHRTERASVPAAHRRTNAELLGAGIGLEEISGLPDAVADHAELPPAPDPVRPGPPPDLAVWRTERQRALAASRRPTTIAATALTDEGGADGSDEGELSMGELLAATPPIDPGLQKRPRDLDLPPWQKGRYGTEVGRAVHGVLQTIDLSDGSGLDAAVAAQCEAEAIPTRAATVRELVAAALGSAVVREAANLPHWREIYACTPIETPVGPRLLEGYVDLLYRTLGGLVVVDYKTAASADPAELSRRVEGYRLQGASYALTVAAAVAEPVHKVVFLFLTPQGAVERELTGLAASVERVRELVATGTEIEVPEPE